MKLRLQLIRIADVLEVLDDRLANTLDALQRDDLENRPFVMRNHLQYPLGGNNDFWRPAFSIEDGRAEDYTLKCRAEELMYDERHELFYFGDQNVGVTEPGLFELEIFRRGKLIATRQMFCLQSSMTAVQRDMMLDDLLYISRELLTTSTPQLQSGQLALHSPQQIHRRYLEVVNDALVKILPTMDRIERQPRFELHSRTIQINRHKFKKIDSKIFRQYSANPARQKYLAADFERSIDIYEHRLLLYLFNRLKQTTAEFDAKFVEQEFILEQKIEDSRQKILLSKRKGCWAEYEATIKTRLRMLKSDARRQFEREFSLTRQFDRSAECIGGLGLRGLTPNMRVSFKPQHGLLFAFPGTGIGIIACNEKQISAALRLNELLQNGGETGIFGGWRKFHDEIDFVEVMAINGKAIEMRETDREECIDLYFRSTTARDPVWTDFGEMHAYKFKLEPFRFDERRQLLVELNARLDHILHLKLFEGIEEREHERRLTQIFSNDRNYRRVYSELRELDRLCDFAFDGGGETIMLEQ